MTTETKSLSPSYLSRKARVGGARKRLDGRKPPPPGSLPQGEQPSLTPRQVEVLREIIAWLTRYGVYPTFDELCHATGISSPNGITWNVQALTRKGYLYQVPNKSTRGFRVVGLKVCVEVEVGTPEGRRLRAALGQGKEAAP